MITALYVVGPVIAREKIDVITLRGGDRVTGEIKQLDLGVLTVGTEHMGTVSIEWVGVRMIESQQLFEIEEADGERFVGDVGPGANGVEFEVVGEDGTFVLAHDDIVRIAQLEEGWWDRWRGFIDLGASFASAGNQADLSLTAEATYRSERFQLKNVMSGTISERDLSDNEGEGTTRSETSQGSLGTTYQRILNKRWFWYSELQFVRNEQLNLHLRSTVSAGFGRYVHQTPRSQLHLSAGVSAVREDYLQAEPGEWSSEAVLATGYQLFIFEGRETSLAANLSVSPSLTVENRYRVEFVSSLRRKMVRDFTVSLSLEESYDSRPPEGAESSDTRLRTSLGWSF